MLHKKLFITAFITAFMLALASCGEITADDKSIETVVIADVNECAYTIIRPDTSGDAITKASVNLRNAIKDAGMSIDISTDWVNRGEEVPMETLEILIGETNRTESSALAAGLGRKDFAVDYDGVRVTIIGGSDSATAAGVDWFIENCISEGQISVQTEVYRYTHEFIKLDLDGCVITPGAFGQAAAKTLQESLYDLTDISFEIGDGNGFCFGLDENLSPNEYKLYMDNGDLILSAGSINGFDHCINALSYALKNGEKLSQNFERSGSFELNIPEYIVNPYFIGTTDKNPLEYECGEAMTFSLTLYDGNKTIPCDYFLCTVDRDFGTSETFKLTGSAGGLTIKADSPTEAGFVRVTVDAVVDDKTVATFDGGAGADLASLLPAREEPADFMSWWENQIAILDDIEPIELEHTEHKSGYYAKIDMGDMDPVSISVSIPKDAEKGSLKLKMKYHGYTVSDQTSTAEIGYIVILVNAHSIDNGRDESYYDDLKNGALQNFGFKNNNTRESCYFYEMILRDMQAIRYGMASEYWNGEDIEIAGGSMGGYRSVAMAALLGDKTDNLTLTYPWFGDLYGRSIGRMSGWLPTWTEALDYFDMVNFARHIVCKTDINAGLGDYTVTPSSLVAMFNVMSCEKSLTFMQNRTHSYYPPTADTFEYLPE